MSKLIELFISFIKIGTFGFGGGQAMLPLIQDEAVDNNRWITEAEFGDFLAIGNSLPGPIATKMSIIIGYDVAGILGAVTALTALILPSAIAIIALYSLFQANKDSAAIKGMQKAVKPVVVMLIFGVAFGMARSNVFVNVDVKSVNTWIIFGLFIVSGILVMLNEFHPTIDIHPAFIIMGALLIGALFIR